MSWNDIGAAIDIAILAVIVGIHLGMWIQSRWPHEKRAPTLPADPAKRAKVVQGMVDARLITEARAEQLMESQEKDPDRCVCGCSLDNDHTPGGGCLNGCSPSQCVPDGAYQRYLKMTGGR